MKKILAIEGMTCNHCVMRVTGALKGVRGVESVSVDLKAKRAVVESGGETNEAALINAVGDAGYEVTSVTRE